MQLITINEVAAKFGISKVTLYNWTSQKKIPYLKLGNKLRFDAAAIEGWLLKQVVNPLKK